MGYTTDFAGELKFGKELTASQLAYLKSFFGKDRRDMEGVEGDWYYIDVEFNDTFTGIKHDGSEKTYAFTDIINFLIQKMKEQAPDFVLTGELLAQGEDLEDRWRLVMKDNIATTVPFPKTGDRITCPHCEEDFLLEHKEN